MAKATHLTPQLLRNGEDELRRVLLGGGGHRRTLDGVAPLALESTEIGIHIENHDAATLPASEQANSTKVLVLLQLERNVSRPKILIESNL